mmetsp:Transcript_4884/g.9267  ORF Transcript_4884/g.9267 Transcript_4884/m.9267 type:complete len:205 (+) Transcript_4884:1831-2445(+)
MDGLRFKLDQSSYDCLRIGFLFAILKMGLACELAHVCALHFDTGARNRRGAARLLVAAIPREIADNAHHPRILHYGARPTRRFEISIFGVFPDNILDIDVFVSLHRRGLESVDESPWIQTPVRGDEYLQVIAATRGNAFVLFLKCFTSLDVELPTIKLSAADQPNGTLDRGCELGVVVHAHSDSHLVARGAGMSDRQQKPGRHP